MGYPAPGMALPSVQAAQVQGRPSWQELGRGMEIIDRFLFRELDGWVFVELDVGSEKKSDGPQIQEILYKVVSSGSIGPYITSPWGFKFRHLGRGEPVIQTEIAPPVSQTLAPSLSWVFLTKTSLPLETGYSLHPEPKPACLSASLEPNCYL